MEKALRPPLRNEKAVKAVARRGASIAPACRAFQISECCYRYERKLGDENAEIADWLCRLTRRRVARLVADPRTVGLLVMLGQDELPPAWLSPPSGANYAVVLVGGERARRIGVVHVGQAVGNGRVLGE